MNLVALAIRALDFYKLFRKYLDYTQKSFPPVRKKILCATTSITQRLGSHSALFHCLSGIGTSRQ